MQACTGAIPGDSDAKVTDLSDDSPDSPPPGSKACASLPVTERRAVPLRRLTRIEYANTVRDLLGVTVKDMTALPADDALGGYFANATLTVSAADAESYQQSAETAAAAMAVTKSLPCDVVTQGERGCAQTFITNFGMRAFRRKISDDRKAALLALYDNKRARGDFEGAIRLVVATILQSAGFLYREDETTNDGRLSDYSLATRLSYLLWASPPDAELLELAAKGQLNDLTVMKGQVKRLMSSTRADAAWSSFIGQWLGMPKLEQMSKDASLYPQFTAALKTSMQAEVDRFAVSVFRGQEPTLQKLLQSNVSFVDSSLAKLYDVPAPAKDFDPVTLPAERRFGALTLPGWLAATSLPDQPSPIHRGLFIRRRLLCQEVPDPPRDLMVVAPKFDPNVPTKQRLEAHRSDPSCSGCHALMDPLGFGFAHYDAIGRYRTMDGNTPVDSKGALTGTTADGDFDGARELVSQLLKTDEVASCFTTQWLRFARGVAETEAEICEIEQVTARWKADNFNILTMVAQIVQSPLLMRQGSQLPFEESSP
ncbi:MAG: DUF1592 domain-containing protein [Deltaproteobacteria bacterium]|nr:DUF1592 domain-containing protein [Deltaproteobacteria bacterium]